MSLRPLPLRRLLDMAMPRRCAACGARLSPTERVVCSTCYMHIPRTGHGLRPRDNNLARVFWGLADVERAAAPYRFTSHSELSRMIYAMKYRLRPDIGTALGRMAAGELAATGFFDGIDVIVPVPLARRRLRERGYNQSEAIARGVKAVTGIGMETKALVRTVYEASQTSLQRWQRVANVGSAFSRRHADGLRGKHVLILDDVVTTGATMLACASTLACVEDITVSVMALAFTE